MKTRHQHRSGNVLVLTVIMMMVMFGMIAFAVDLGYIQVVRSQMQSSADAAALAAGWDLIDEQALTGYENLYLEMEARYTAEQYSWWNPVGGAAPALAYEDVEIGYLANPSDPNAVMSFADPSTFNAVRVRVRRTADQNGGVFLFFARALGIETYSGQAQATAVFLNNVSGFRIPSSGENLGILPFAFDKTFWDELMAGAGDDNWTPIKTWNEELQEWEETMAPGQDGIREINLFPPDAGAPGNFGTINIGGNNNSTNVLRRQIELGLTAEDMSYYPNSELVIDSETGEVPVTGDTGISAGMESVLQAIIGQPRIVPLYSQVTGQGSNTTYSIVQFVGVRVVEVEFQGGLTSSKRLVLQPAIVTIPGAIRTTVFDPMNPTPDEQRSQFVYSPVYLVR